MCDVTSIASVSVVVTFGVACETLLAVVCPFSMSTGLAVSTPETLNMPLEERSPCGLCRQVIREFADEDTLVICDSGEDDILGDILDIERLLPFGFQFTPPQAD